jgi:hypothetical protein
VDETLDRTIGTVGPENAKNSRILRSFLLFINSCCFHSPRYFPKQLHSQTLKAAIFEEGVLSHNFNFETDTYLITILYPYLEAVMLVHFLPPPH